MELFERLKNYKANSINNRLTAEESAELLRLHIKAMAPPVEAVLSEPNSEKEYTDIDTFDNVSDSTLENYGDFISETFTDICITMGKELGKWMYKHDIAKPTDDQMDEFCAENNLPPRLFNKALVLSHMYLTELGHRNANPLPVIINADSILKSAEKNVRGILMTAVAVYHQLKDNE